MNGASMTGRADATATADRDGGQAAAPRAVILSDGTRLLVK